MNVTIEEEEGRFAAFLEAQFSVTSLRLLTFVSSTKATYVSAIAWEGTILNTEIQLTGKVGDAQLLAERLTGDVTVVRCFIFVNIGKKDCPMVADEGKWQLKIRKSHVDLGTGLLEEWLM